MFLFYHCEKQEIFNELQSANLNVPDHHIFPEKILTHADSLVIAKMPQYYHFLQTLKNSGYTFIDFRTFIHSDKSLLPQKLIVIRHDVHRRDVSWAYIAYQIEEIVIGTGHSTFFVMLHDPCEMEQTGQNIQDSYLQLIHYLDSNGVDIQPHISPIDMYIKHAHPFWENFPLDTLQQIFDHDYFFGKYKEGKSIQVRGKDVFRINSINSSILKLLLEYNKEWKKLTGLTVQGYAAHGSATPMNKVLNNANILDQQVLTKAGVYQYDTYNSAIFKTLTYLSDNTLPDWMKKPETIQPARYQFLMHPYQWINNRN